MSALIDSYICVNRLAEAKATYAQSIAHGFNGDGGEAEAPPHRVPRK